MKTSSVLLALAWSVLYLRARHYCALSPVRTVILLVCAAQQRMKEGGVLPLPKVEMVKRKTGSYELLPDH